MVKIIVKLLWSTVHARQDDHLFQSTFHAHQDDQYSSRQCFSGLKGEDRGIFLIRHLAICAKCIEDGDFKNAGIALKDIACVSSLDGDTMQRLATFFEMAFSYRLIKQIRHVPGVFNCLKFPWSTSERQYARKLFFDFLPFLKFSYLITNQAILEAMGEEPVFHIIDLSASNAAQWVYLLQTLKEQHQGSRLPLVKITMIHENKDILEKMGFELIQKAQKMNFPFELYAIVGQLENICFETLPHLKPGEPIAISSVLILHSLLAVDDQVSPDSDVLLKMRQFLIQLWKLHPRLMVITEQESDNNGPSLTDTLDKALNFYAALFDCLEANVPKEREIERIMVERMILGEEIKNMVACDGVDRKERHGKFLKTWRPSLQLAEFRRVSMNYERMLQVTTPLMQNYGPGYKLIENNQCLFTCWNDLPLYSISAWRY
ncbi:scarecrow-like protein 3 [Neltuma alba]|uniref:scarecrow-like protein 3 n=1 Tax=Neltuma alba TaxID=207710 RepID=UPI0010A45D98|nr:scarecrow-like protein 3 [Prosopis alba]